MEKNTKREKEILTHERHEKDKEIIDAVNMTAPEKRTRLRSLADAVGLILMIDLHPEDNPEVVRLTETTRHQLRSAIGLDPVGDRPGPDRQDREGLKGGDDVGSVLLGRGGRVYRVGRSRVRRGLPRDVRGVRPPGSYSCWPA